MVAKLDGFLDSPAQTLRRYPESDGSEAATLAAPSPGTGAPTRPGPVPRCARLIAARPDDPYYHELAGQFLLEVGQAGGGSGGLPRRRWRWRRGSR